jgi:hypothetical protein
LTLTDDLLDPLATRYFRMQIFTQPNTALVSSLTVPTAGMYEVIALEA